MGGLPHATPVNADDKPLLCRCVDSCCVSGRCGEADQSIRRGPDTTPIAPAVTTDLESAMNSVDHIRTCPAYVDLVKVNRPSESWRQHRPGPAAIRRSDKPEISAARRMPAGVERCRSRVRPETHEVILTLGYGVDQSGVETQGVQAMMGGYEKAATVGAIHREPVDVRRTQQLGQWHARAREQRAGCRRGERQL